MSQKEMLNLFIWAAVCAGAGWIVGRLALIALSLFFPIKLWWVLKAGPVGAVIGVALAIVSLRFHSGDRN